MAVHHTGVYRSRFADYVILDVQGSHRAWRTNRLADPHIQTPHHHDAVAQTDCFEIAFNDSSKRWNGSPATHVAIYGNGRPNQPWMAFHVPPYIVERLIGRGVAGPAIARQKNARRHPDTDPSAV